MSKFKIYEHKLMYHAERVAQWERDPANTFPLYVEISPVGYCNHRCSFCALDYLEYKHVRLDVEVLKRTLVNMKAHGVKSVMFAGEGEPMLHPDIADLVAHAHNSGLDVAITTNGTVLTPDFVQRVLKHCTWVKISCNAGNANVYAQVHGCPEAHWDKLWDNVRYAVEYRNSVSADTAIGVQSVLLPENAATLQQLAKRAKHTGVDYLVVKPYSQHGSSLNSQYKGIVYDEVYDKYMSALSMYASSNFEIVTRHRSMEDYGEENRKLSYERCLSVPYLWAYVMADGSLYGCSAFLGDPRFCYGNVNEESFSTIWLGGVRKSAMRYMQHEFDIGECRKNCRMHKINSYLWDVRYGGEHRNFI